MVGLNLSQPSLQDVERETAQRKKNSFNLGLALSIGFLVLVFLVWGILYYLLGSVDRQVATADDMLSASTSSFRGDAIDKILAFDDRLHLINKGLAAGLDPKSQLDFLENLMVQGVSLDSYEYDAEARVIKIKAHASNIRSIAEQLMSFQNEKSLTKVQSEGVNRDQEGRLTFNTMLFFK